MNVHLRVFPMALFFIGIVAGNAVPVFAASAEKSAEAQETSELKRFNFADVHRRAAVLAEQPFKEEEAALPDYLRDLNYDQYQDIRFRTDKTLWRQEKLPFEVQFFSRGFMFNRRVAINIVDSGEVTPVTFARDLFDFGRNPIPEEMPADLGFAGFRLLYPINRDDFYDEVAVFLGASYFRSVGQHQNYGISARGLAIDTGLTKVEEFPFFREFWIEKPDRDATSINVYALLDSDSVTGAYRFIIKPGLATVIEVKANLFLRKKVEKLGVAPLTTMFFHGDLTERYMDDFRPGVHDSDGLLMAMGSGERLWRPLNNPRRLRITSFQDQNPRGFGLLQRDRNFSHYQDLESLYHTRPSTWVEPIGDWGKGVVQLIEIPSEAERYDNIVAFWIPEGPAEAGQELVYEYRLSFGKDPEGRLVGGKTLASFVGSGGTDILQHDRRRFVIDFVGEELAQLNPEEPVEIVVNASSGQVINSAVQQNPFTGGWRGFFELVPEGTSMVDLRVFLKRGPDVLTETWSYQWNPE